MGEGHWSGAALGLAFRCRSALALERTTTALAQTSMNERKPWDARLVDWMSRGAAEAKSQSSLSNMLIGGVCGIVVASVSAPSSTWLLVAVLVIAGGSIVRTLVARRR
jgi:hypothetical protein